MEIVLAQHRANGCSAIQMVPRSTRSPPLATLPSRGLFSSKLTKFQHKRQSRPHKISASLPVHAVTSTVQLSSTLFTLATTLVMPFYTIMILAPKKTWTKRVIESNIPHVVLGAMYTYLLSISWTPNTLHYMFATKHYLPELAGITQMFASTVTVASAWVHLLAADLFVGRQIYLEGLEHNIETRHSLILCLMFCPIGMICHIFTKALTLMNRVPKVHPEKIAAP
ncbi:protein ABA DEFICIENT 4, chloroplastic [Selaginella moellendorffii]|uniref:protein ABA DEFICIENT 4, chloroplastic n=1 Tax=Selaginella moellendorffii TaxID=88036 RepID=UPI000D1CC6A1|nr:protein ABA DEFICIENT 4, chloroplastic [Selaginella moellendorffii]|eukprot:XP_024535986.1 protein ABA DEFICIENT 4, chloroplastic [Selaginella moellendorffii]